MTFRGLRVLLEQLPDGSRLAQAEHGEVAAWKRQDWMIADLIDVAQAQRYAATAAASKKPGPPPKPYPRPTTEDRARSLTPRLEQWRDRHERGDDGD